MSKLRWFILGIISFFGFIFAHGSWINRLLALILCGLLGADSGLCMATAAKYSGKTVAATPAMVEEILLAQRSREFDDPPVAPPPGNSQQAPPFPYDPGPNQPLRPDFRNGDPDVNQPNQNRVEQDIANLDGNFQVMQLRENLYQNVFVSPKRCKVVTVLETLGDIAEIKSVRFMPLDTNTCQTGFWFFEFQEHGTKLEIIETNTQESLFFELLENDTILQVTYRDRNGSQEVHRIPYTKNKQNKKTHQKILMADVGDDITNSLMCDLCNMMGTIQDIYFGVGKGGTVDDFLGTAASYPVSYPAGVGVYSRVAPIPGRATSFSGAMIGVINILISLITKFDESLQLNCKDRPFCKATAQNNQPTQNDQPTRTSQPSKICQVSDQFWKTHKRVIGPVNLEEHACIVPGAVMTSQGMVDGNEFCAVCYRTGNNTFGQPPDRALCSQPEDPARRNPVPNCPDNWAG